MAYIPPTLRRAIAERARYRCEYCQSPERITGGPLHVEHIFPETLGGPTALDNLAFACARCNLHKGVRTQYLDPLSGRNVRLFNPRTQTGQLVTKDDLFAAAWPETVVSDATLASCIQEIRQALGDEAKRPCYIETVHRRGFRFIAPLSPAPPVPGSKFNVPSEDDKQEGNGRETELGSLDEALRLRSGQAPRDPGGTPEPESRIALRSIRATELKGGEMRNKSKKYGE